MIPELADDTIINPAEKQTQEMHKGIARNN